MSATVAPPKFLTVAQAAERLSVSRWTIYRRVWSGELPAIRLGPEGSALRIREDELEQWLYEDPAAAFSGTSPQPVSPERRAPTVEGQSTAQVRSGPEEAA
jgi:excisionase family DNA binding protein